MNNRKITDIYSPGKEKKSLPPLKIKKSKAYSLFSGKKSLFYFLLFLLLPAIFCYFILPYLMGQAEIEIWPETEVLSLETRITADKEIKEYSILEAAVPARVFQKEKTIIESFSSSGKVAKEGKAEGIIRVYNAYSVSPQILVATTRFVSADGKVFRTPIAVTIPGGKYEGGKFVPGEIDIKVAADQSGTEYNIGPSTFSIPGFAGTDRYTKFYAKSFQAMEGGFQEEVLKVTKEDLDRAENFLTNQAAKECGELLANELQSEDISAKFNYFLKDFQARIVEKNSLSFVDEETEEFKFQVKAFCETLLIEKKDLMRFAEESLIPQIGEGKELYEESIKIDCFSEDVNLDAGRIIVLANISGKIFPEIDVYNLKKALSGKSALEIKLFLENQPKIIKAAVSFWPFWAKKAPEDSNRIKIKINID